VFKYTHILKAMMSSEFTSHNLNASPSFSFSGRASKKLIPVKDLFAHL